MRVFPQAVWECHQQGRAIKQVTTATLIQHGLILLKRTDMARKAECRNKKLQHGAIREGNHNLRTHLDKLSVEMQQLLTDSRGCA